MKNHFVSLKKDFIFYVIECVPFLFLVLINQILFKTYGQYSLRGLLDFTIYSSLLFGIYLYKNKVSVSKIKTEKLLYLALIIFATYGLRSKSYGDKALDWFVHLPYLLLIIVGLYGLFANQKKILNYLLPILIVGLLLNYLYIILFLETPFIDIWYIFTDACASLSQGINPYALTYKDIYNGLYSANYTEPHLVYWPINLIFCLAGYLVGDVRFGIFIALVLTLIGLYKLARLNEYSKHNSMLVVLIFLCFSVGLYEFYFCWTETIILPFVVFSLYFYKKRNLVFLGITLGLLAGTKQSMLMYLILFMSLVYTQLSTKDFIKLVLISGLSFFILMFPFIYPDPVLFYKHTVQDLVICLPRTDSFSWISYLITKQDFAYQQNLFGMLSLGLCVIFSALIFWKKSTVLFFYLLVVLYFVIFMTAKQSFCNYYYLLEFFALMWFLFDRFDLDKVVVNENQNTHKVQA